MKFGLFLLLSVLAVLTFAIAPHQAMASANGLQPCADAIHSPANQSDKTADPAHCSPCCQATQALPLFSDAAAFVPAATVTVVRFPKYAELHFSPSDKPFRPPRLV